MCFRTLLLCVCVFNSRKQEERTKWSPTDHYPSRLHIFSVISVIYIVMWNDLIIIRLDYEIIPNEKIRYQHFYGKYNYQIQTLEYRQGQFEMYFIFYFVIRFVISLFSTSSHLKMTVKMIFPLLQHGRNVSVIFTWQRHIWVWTPEFLNTTTQKQDFEIDIRADRWLRGSIGSLQYFYYCQWQMYNFGWMRTGYTNNQ